MASERLIKELNNQIQREFASEYIYIAMEAYCSDQNLDGFANFFHVQAQEERDHAYKLFDYVGRIGGKVELEALEKPQADYASPQEVIEAALNHEKYITKSIHDIFDIALEERDHTTTAFLQWYINEQAEEEESVDKILKKIKLLKGDPAGLLIIDQELAQRVYTPLNTQA